MMINRTEQEIMQNWKGDFTQPLASVCCITYNHKHYISQAIDSFLMQETDFPFEILIHDDASVDGTSVIVLEYAEKYPNLIKPIIQIENQGSKMGLINPRFVFPKAKGRYIALCDGDDYWTDCTKLQKQVQFLECHLDYVITYTDSQPFDENGYLDFNTGAAKRDVSSDELKRCVSLPTLTSCFRNLITEVPLDLYSARIGDVIIWSLLGAYGKGKYLSDILPAAYRVHDGGIYSKKTKQQKGMMRFFTLNAACAYYERIGDADTARHYSEHSFREHCRVIGWKRLIVILFQALNRRMENIFRVVKKYLNN